eukprot:gene27681-36434_t
MPAQKCLPVEEITMQRARALSLMSRTMAGSSDQNALFMVFIASGRFIWICATWSSIDTLKQVQTAVSGVWAFMISLQTPDFRQEPIMRIALSISIAVLAFGSIPGAASAGRRQAGGQAKVTDGPFAEAKEMVGGFFLLEDVSRDEALAIAQPSQVLPVWTTVAKPAMAAQKHLWAYYERVALQRGMQGGRNTGAAMTYGEAYQRLFPMTLEVLA